MLPLRSGCACSTWCRTTRVRPENRSRTPAPCRVVNVQSHREWGWAAPCQVMDQLWTAYPRQAGLSSVTSAFTAVRRARALRSRVLLSRQARRQNRRRGSVVRADRPPALANSVHDANAPHCGRGARRSPGTLAPRRCCVHAVMVFRPRAQPLKFHAPHRSQRSTSIATYVAKVCDRSHRSMSV